MRWIKAIDKNSPNGLIVCFVVGDAKVKKLGCYDKGSNSYHTYNEDAAYFPDKNKVEWLYEEDELPVVEDGKEADDEMFKSIHKVLMANLKEDWRGLKQLLKTNFKISKL